MAPDPSNLRFYVDESALGVGKALTIARRDTVHVGHPLVPACPLGALDTEWIPAVAALDLVVIGRDRRIRTRPQEVRHLRDAGLRVFHIAGKRDLSTWDWLTRLVRQWDRMEEIVRTRPAGPWFYAVHDHAITEITV